jgi:hypothetical protein
MVNNSDSNNIEPAVNAEATWHIDFVFPSSMIEGKPPTQILIQGSGFTGVQHVRIGDYTVPPKHLTVTDKQIVIKSPSSKTEDYGDTGPLDLLMWGLGIQDIQKENAFTILAKVKFYRAYYKKAEVGRSWSGCSRKDGKDADDKEISLPDIHSDDTNVWKVTVLPVLTDGTVLGAQPGTDYPPDGDEGIEVAWTTGSVVMPANLTATSERTSSGVLVGAEMLSWDPAMVAPNSDSIEKYRVFYQKHGNKSWSDAPYTDSDGPKPSVRLFKVPLSDYDFTVLPIRNGKVIGAGKDERPLPVDESNMVGEFGRATLIMQYPPSHGSVFVPLDSVGAASIFAAFNFVTGKVDYEWRTDSKPDGSFDNIPDQNRTSGHDTALLTFGTAKGQVTQGMAEKGDGGWYRLRTETGASENPTYSDPVHVWIGSSEFPALTSQSPGPMQEVFAREAHGETQIQAKFNGGIVPSLDPKDYRWQWSEDNINGVYMHGSSWGRLEAVGPTLAFGTHSRKASSRDSGWYRVEVKKGDFTVWSDPVHVTVGGEYASDRAKIVSQYPQGGETVTVPFKKRPEAQYLYEYGVSISAYPQFPSKSRYGHPINKISTVWQRGERTANGGFNPIEMPKEGKYVLGTNTTTLWFDPNGSKKSQDDYAKKVNGWYRLSVTTTYDRVWKSNIPFIDPIVEHIPTEPVYSEPVYITVVESMEPKILNRTADEVYVTSGTENGPSIGAYYEYMDGVVNGYRWEYSVNGDDNIWGGLPTDGIAGQGTPTLTFGIPGGGAKDGSAGHYRLQVQNPYGSATSDHFTVTVEKDPTPDPKKISPSEGSKGTRVTITGYLLDKVTSVSFGGNEVKKSDFKYQSDTQIILDAPEHQAGTIDVIVKIDEKHQAGNLRFTYS